MAFNTKIKLANTNVEQSSTESLTLSGHTQISTGTAILNYTTHPNFTGATQIVDKQYVDFKASGASGSTIYMPPLLSPAQCIVGGITVGYVLTGKSSNCILQDMLYPEICGALTNASVISLVLSPSTSPLEIGTVIPSLSITANFSRGCINPQGCSASPYRSGPANHYCFTGPQTNGNRACTANSAVTGATSYTIVSGNNTWGVCVASDAGVQPKSNKGNNFSSPLAACTSPAVTSSISGILPYFYGYSVSQPTPGSGLLALGTKVVADSNGEIDITYGVQASKWLWFATPAASTIKLGWYEGATNKGNIGGPTDFFGAPTTLAVTSPDSCWTGCNYRFYVTNYVAVATSGNPYCMTNNPQQ